MEKWCLSISDVYGTVPTVAPEGYEFTGEFRPALTGEFFLKLNSLAAQPANHKSEVPRLILRKKPPVPTVKDIYGVERAQDVKVPEGYELTGEFRVPVKGDEWINRYQKRDGIDYGPSVWTTSVDSQDGPRLIIRKKSEPKPENIYWLSEETLRRRTFSGFEWTGEFRKLKVGDYFLSAPRGTYVEHVNDSRYSSGAGGYRFVMRKLPTIKDIYGKELNDLRAPEGYRFTGEFRKPSASDWCMTPGGNDIRYLGINPKHPHVEPRLILEKIHVNPTIEEVYGTANPVIPKGWRFKEFRKVERDEQINYLTWSYPNNVASRNTRNIVSYHGQGWRIVLEEVQDLSQFKYAIGPETVYGTPLPEVPEGYRVVDFRPARKGELYMSIFSGSVLTATYDYSPQEIRLILERR